MSLWLAIPFGAAIIAVLINMIRRRASGGTTLHIDH